MTKEKTKNIKLGIFVFAGLILLVFGLYSIGRNRNMFGKSINVFAVFYDVNGLIPGNNVRYSGIDVGTVTKIEIVSDSSIRVDMVIDESTGKFIRKNSIASVGTDGLMGNKLINISPGTADVGTISDNDNLTTLKAINTDEMLRTLDNTNENISVITSNLRIITENVNKSRGALYTVLTDTMLGHRIGNSLENIQIVTNNLISVSNELHVLVRNVGSGDGTLGMLISDSALATDLRTSILKIREGSDNFSVMTGEINKIVNEINNGSGTATTILKDTTMANDLKRSIDNLEKATVTVNEELEAMKHSFLLRPFYKHQKK